VDSWALVLSLQGPFLRQTSGASVAIDGLQGRDDLASWDKREACQQPSLAWRLLEGKIAVKLDAGLVASEGVVAVLTLTLRGNERTSCGWNME
jgi:hypothetical protein